MEYILRQALVRDVKGIHALLRKPGEAGQLLPRSLSDLYAHTRDFMVLANSAGAIAGCCALSIVWEDVAEIRSLYVLEELRGQGKGRLLVEACLEEARKIGVGTAFTLTYKTSFFSGLGFAVVGMEMLPQKIWADCIHCPKFPDCDEVAMQRAV